MEKSTPPSEGSLRYNIPRLSFPYLETLITKEEYHHFEGTGVTTCNLVVVNGYSVTESAVCANIQHFDIKRGREQARKKALTRLMELEHYLLRQRLHEAGRRPEEQKHDH